LTRLDSTIGALQGFYHKDKIKLPRIGKEVKLISNNLVQNENFYKDDYWFLYWKTSASLWKTKMEEVCPGPRVLVPINWAFHTENGEDFDFSEKKPETDLELLVSRAKEIGKEIIFLLPVGPAPFLTNCGVPHFLARNFAKDLNGQNKFVIDADGNINKIFSFFDPRIFKGYSRFVHFLGQYFRSKKLNNQILGMRSGYLKEKKMISYIEDHSDIFLNAFSKYLEGEKQIQETKNIEEYNFLSPLFKEKELRRNFTQTIQSFYIDEASRNLSKNWDGALTFSFVGGGPEDFFNKFSAQEEITNYSRSLFDSLSLDVIPSTLLVNEEIKKGVLCRQYKDIVEETYLPIALGRDLYVDEHLSLFKDMHFFEVFRNLSNEGNCWDKQGLYEYLDIQFPRVYKIKETENFKYHDEEEENPVIKFIQARNLDLKKFNQLIKTFLMGGKIIVDRSGLDPDLSKKLESFLLENSIHTQKVRALTDINYSVLGMGGLLCYEGDLIQELSQSNKVEFWKKLISMFEKNHAQVIRDPKVEFFWRKRAATTNELNYEEIRRLNIYNPSSYKQKCKVLLESKFAIIKVNGENNSHVQTGPSEINIDLLPKSQVIIDLGLFE
jgi:hypothetical protein